MASVKLQPVKLLYCEVCSMPPEYCEFGPDFEKCKPWLVENSPDTYPELKEVADAAAEQLEALGLDPEAALLKAGPTSKEEPKEEVKRLPGGKVKKKDKAEVIVEKVTRNKRKSVTSIKGLDTFGIKLSDAAKKMGKKFACGASVVKGPTEKEQVDVQGDILYDAFDFLTQSYPEIPAAAIYLLEDGKKVPAG